MVNEAHQKVEALRKAIADLRQRGETFRKEASDIRTSPTMNPVEKTERVAELRQRAQADMNQMQATVDRLYGEARSSADAAVAELVPQVEPMQRMRADARLKQLLDARSSPLEVARDAERHGDLGLLEALGEHLDDAAARGVRVDQIKNLIAQTKLKMLNEPEQRTAASRVNDLERGWSGVQAALRAETENLETANGISTALALRNAGLRF